MGPSYREPWTASEAGGVKHWPARCVGPPPLASAIARARYPGSAHSREVTSAEIVSALTAPHLNCTGVLKRTADRAMDDEAALIARRVAMAAAAWFNASADVEAYRRLAAAVQEWNLYCAPHIDPSPADEELLDEFADTDPPEPLAALLPDVAASLRRQARRQLGP